jgi:hypothetical protein
MVVCHVERACLLATTALRQLWDWDVRPVGMCARLGLLECVHGSRPLSVLIKAVRMKDGRYQAETMWRSVHIPICGNPSCC